MPRAILFDLDMTLVDSSAVADLRRMQLWPMVRQNMNLIRPFPTLKGGAPHELPTQLKQAGEIVGIVTSSPEWYAQQILAGFQIPYDVLITHGDTENHKPGPEPLQEAFRRLGFPPTSQSCYVGDDVIDVEAAYHAGISSIAVKWGPGSIFALASAAPDIFIAKPSTLLQTDRLSGRAYIGEALTSGWPFHAHWGSVLHCDEDPTVYALGRYFTTSDPRHAAGMLTAAVLSLKNDDSKAKVLGECVGRAIDGLDWTPDYIVPVPMKPSQERNRFKKLLEEAEAHFEEDIEVVLDGLRCVKEIEGYKQMKAFERAEAIEGAFASNYKWKGKILLLDDVYTTGGTTNECVRMLLAAGATEVRVMALAKDQLAFVHKNCPVCGRTMRVRANSQTNVKFWGCSGYPDHCQNTENF